MADTSVAERLIAEYAARPTRENRDRVVEAHLYIARIIAQKFSGRGADYDDLYQVAALALVKAVERYDPARGVKLQSFATPNMVGEVKNYFRDRTRALRLPRRGMQLARDIERAREQLVQQHHREPRADELAGALNVSEDAVLEALEIGAVATVSLDAGREDGESPSLDAFLGIEDRGFSEFEKNDAVRRAMDALEPRRREIIRLRFFENRSQREVAQALGVSQMTVSREERRALEQMKGALDPDARE